MKKTVKNFYIKLGIVATILFALTFASCRLGYTVKNARFANEYVGVYEEHSFDFKDNKSGSIDGSFKLPKCVDHRGLNFEVKFPAIFRNHDWNGIVGKMSYELILEWEGGRLEKKEDNKRGDWFGLDIYITEEECKLLPLKEPITYTFKYSDAQHAVEPHWPSHMQVEAQEKLAGLNTYPDKYLEFYEAVFVVAEQSTMKMPK